MHETFITLQRKVRDNDEREQFLLQYYFAESN